MPLLAQSSGTNEFQHLGGGVPPCNFGSCALGQEFEVNSCDDNLVNHVRIESQPQPKRKRNAHAFAGVSWSPDVAAWPSHLVWVFPEVLRAAPARRTRSGPRSWLAARSSSPPACPKLTTLGLPQGVGVGGFGGRAWGLGGRARGRYLPLPRFAKGSCLEN